MATISASENAQLANELLSAAMAGELAAPSQPASALVPPPDCMVKLPGGYLAPDGEIVREAEVRELTGTDEEALSRFTSPSRLYLAVLSRGVVSIGSEKATEAVLDGMLVGDRDYLMLAVYKATFGSEVSFSDVWCPECEAPQDAVLDLDSGVSVKSLNDPQDRRFTVAGRRRKYSVMLPTGHAQRAIANRGEASEAEMTTEVLFNTVIEIGGTSVISKEQIKDIGMADRRTLGEELNERAIGPDLSDCAAECQSCHGKVTVSLNIGNLFRS
jgi:hypothetical protein